MSQEKNTQPLEKLPFGNASGKPYLTCETRKQMNTLKDKLQV